MKLHALIHARPHSHRRDIIGKQADGKFEAPAVPYRFYIVLTGTGEREARLISIQLTVLCRLYWPV